MVFILILLLLFSELIKVLLFILNKIYNILLRYIYEKLKYFISYEKNLIFNEHYKL